MPDYDDTSPIDDSQPQENFDPLGIMGWVIGGKYKIQGYLGGGGFGEVYEAYNENLQEQRLVIKFFKRVQAREKFDKEAKILCMLDHPNISRVIDYLPEEGAVVVAFIDGKDGAVILKESGALKEELFLKVARGISSAIAYAHEKKIAHRDIKPGNIIIDKHENVYLIDFGIAKEMGTEATKTAYTALTPMFAAPERQSGEKGYNPFLSDVYETGVTLFNLATNSLPYRNPTNPLFEEWGGMAAKRLSPDLTRILKKATHPVPAKRYSSAAEMAADLRNLKMAFGGGGKRSRWPVIAAAIVLLAIVGYFGSGPIGNLFSSKSADETPPATSTSSQQVEDQQIPAAIEDTAAQTSAQLPETTSTQSTGPSSSQAAADQKPAVVEPQEVVNNVETAKDTSGTGNETQKADESVTEEKPKPKPPPPPKSEVFLGVIPNDSVVLFVDGVQRQAGQRFTIDAGQYDMAVIQPDFPIYRGTLNAASGKVDRAVDLAELSGTLDTIGLQISIIPTEPDYVLELKRNGRRKLIFSFPYLGLAQLTGEWSFEVDVKPVGAALGKNIKVDSCVIFPYNPDLRQVIRGGSGILKVGKGTGQSASSARFLVYYSEK